MRRAIMYRTLRGLLFLGHFSLMQNNVPKQFRLWGGVGEEPVKNGS